MIAIYNGKFKDLKPMGFTFHKLYANNYKVYEKNKVWIFVARREIEVRDLYNNSAYIIKLIIDNKYPLYKEDSMFGDQILFNKGEPKGCILEYDTGEVMTYQKFLKKYGSYLEADYKKYGDLIIPLNILNTIKEIKNFITIEEN